MLKSNNYSSTHGLSPNDVFNQLSAPSIPPKLDVQRVSQSSAINLGQCIGTMKLTDEVAALMDNLQDAKNIRIRVDEQGGFIEFCDGSSSSAKASFRFQKQKISDPTDTLLQAGKTTTNVGTYRVKYQIQATDRSFEETRKRAEKRAEVEKSRGTKEMKKNVASSSRHSLLGSTSGTPRISNGSRISPSFMMNKASTSSQNQSKGTPNAMNKSEMLREELMSKPLRKRIVHLVCTQKYKNHEDVYKKLKSDGIPKDKDDFSFIMKIIKDVSEMTPSSVHLSLRPDFLSEVDSRWMFYNQEEKSLVRKLQNGTSGSRSMAGDNSSSFAPMRKKGMERMTASSKLNSEKSDKSTSPEEIPTPPSSRSESNPEKTVLSPMSDDESYETPVTGVKRKAHNSIQNTSNNMQTVVPSEDSLVEKRARRNDSSSPPEDPTNNTVQQNETQSKPNFQPMQFARNPLANIESHAHGHQNHHNNNMHHNNSHQSNNNTNNNNINGSNPNRNQQTTAGGSTASSPLSSPSSSLSSPTQPQCDWEKQFSEIKSLSEAENYFSIFHREYPAYAECHNRLSSVSKEFLDLEKKLARAEGRQPDSKEVAEITREIQKRYLSYEKDPEFLKTRQKHANLRSKLAVLKSRLSSWETSWQNM